MRFNYNYRVVISVSRDERVELNADGVSSSCWNEKVIICFLVCLVAGWRRGARGHCAEL